MKKQSNLIKTGVLIINLFVCLLCLSCSDYSKYPQYKHIDTKYIGNGLYSERWVSFQYGVFANNTISYFLTDSTSFVMFLGICDEEEYFDFVWSTDSILLVSKINRISRETTRARKMSYSTIRGAGDKLQ